MNPLEVEAFLAVVATKNMTTAAKSLHITQSTISQRIKSLEDSLGVKLIERQQGIRTIDLTPSGLDFIPLAKNFQELAKEAKELKFISKNPLSISGVDSLNQFIFLPLYDAILEVNNIHLKIFTHQTAEIFDRVDNQLTDIGLVLSKRNYSNVIMEPLYTVRYYLVQKKNHKSKPSQDPLELDYSKEILLDWGPEFKHWHDTWADPKILPYAQVDTLGMLMHFLKEDYWTILPESHINAISSMHNLYVSTLLNEPPKQTCYILTSRFARPSKIRQIKIFKKHLSSFVTKIVLK